MADFERQAAQQYRVGAARAEAGVIDEGLRTYMLRVYNYMASGLALTGIVAFAMAAMATSSPAFAQAVYGSGLMWIIFLAPLGMVFFLSARIGKMSVSGAQTAFWIFAALMGASLSSIFLVYAGADIARVFFITAAAFGALSLYGYTTEKDLSGWGSFLFMGLIGVILALVVNFFLASSALHFAISVIGVLVFAGLTAYDTQRIKTMYYVGDDGTVAGRKAIMGALALYLNFINMFVFLLSLFGGRE